MAGNMKEIRRRIKSFQSTQKITKAMEMVAAAKVRRAQERVQASRPYSDKLREVYAQVSANLPAGEVRHPLLMPPADARRTLLVVVTSDKGLCGGYNANVIRFAVNRAREIKAAGREVSVFVVGNKGIAFFRRSNLSTVGRLANLPTPPTFMEAAVIVDEAQQLYMKGEVDQVELIYTKFHSLARYQPCRLDLLPASLPEAGPKTGAQSSYLFEPDAEQLMGDLIPAYLKTAVFQALLDASASQLASQMMAMGAASKNAGEMIAQLTLVYNKARQASITQEILEVVGGAEALKG